MSLRDASEAFWQGLGAPTPLIDHPQHVMSIHEPSNGEKLAIRPATKGMLTELIESTAMMDWKMRAYPRKRLRSLAPNH